MPGSRSDSREYTDAASRKCFVATASRYNQPFELGEVGGAVGYPAYLKPFDGGQWVGVTRVGSPEELQARYDESGQRLMHLQAAVEGFDVFARYGRIARFVGSLRRDPGRAIPVTITVGLDEENLACNRALAETLAAGGYDVELHESPGGHDWPLWRRQLKARLPELLERAWST